MRFLLPVAAALFLAACSDTPTETKAKAPDKPLTPLTGRQAFQMTYVSAKAWAPDAMPLRIRSMSLSTIPPGPEGTAGVWEITYVSESNQQSRVYTWSAVEAEGNLHKGVFGGLKEGWRSGGQERPFLAAAIKTDTSDALKEATEASEEYLKKPGKKPPITFLLESTPRFPSPTWRVLWGFSVGSAERQVFVDATSGKVVGKE